MYARSEKRKESAFSFRKRGGKKGKESKVVVYTAIKGGINKVTRQQRSANNYGVNWQSALNRKVLFTPRVSGFGR